MANILVVDDSLVDRRLAMNVLQKGMECSLIDVDCAEAALESLATSIDIDLVLTDLQMPGLNGLELVERIRSDWPSLPVVLMTAAGSEDIAAQALKVGASSYVPKRRLSDDLVSTVQKILAAAGQELKHSRLMHSLNQGELMFDLRNDPTLITPLVQVVQEMLRCLPLEDEAERLRVGVAVEEAIRNAIYCGNLEISSSDRNNQTFQDAILERLYVPPYCHRRVAVGVAINRDEAVFSVTDEGPGFDSSTFEASDFDADAPRGRGIRLMRTFMDSVEFREGGRQVVLTKQRYEESEELDGESASA
tara:strand:- start:142264 stop:143178 length:915 start_codon:yes stop_codon:yes gene_type:complete